MLRRHRLACAVFSILTPVAPLSAAIRFEVTFDKKVRSEPFTGRVIIFLSERQGREPRLGQSWLSRQPMFSQDVSNWKPGESLSIVEPNGYPYELSKLPAATYSIQAVLHLNPDMPHAGDAPGN